LPPTPSVKKPNCPPSSGRFFPPRGGGGGGAPPPRAPPPPRRDPFCFNLYGFNFYGET